MKPLNTFGSTMIVRMVFTALILVAGVSTTRAQEVTKVGTDAAPFLTIPVGARGAAVGGALVAMADDASAAYWNPGGLARVERNALMVDHSPWLPGLSFNFFSLALPVGNGAVGLNITSLGTEEMDITTPDQPMGTGETYTAASMAVGLSYAQRLTESFSIGGTVKYINERILNSSAVGVAFDIGTLYDTPFKGVRLGVSVANYGSKMQMRGEDLNIRVDIAPDQNGNNQSVVGQFKTDRFDLPLTMRVGLSWDALQQGGNRLTLAVDGVNPSHNAQSVNVGGEYAMFNETLVLRGGYTDLFLEDSEKGLTLGAGFQAKIQGSIGFSVNYAYQDFEHLGGVDRISVLLSF